MVVSKTGLLSAGWNVYQISFGSACLLEIALSGFRIRNTAVSNGLRPLMGQYRAVTEPEDPSVKTRPHIHFSASSTTKIPEGKCLHAAECSAAKCRCVGKFRDEMSRGERFATKCPATSGPGAIRINVPMVMGWSVHLINAGQYSRLTLWLCIWLTSVFARHAYLWNSFALLELFHRNCLRKLFLRWFISMPELLKANFVERLILE